MSVSDYNNNNNNTSTDMVLNVVFNDDEDHDSSIDMRLPSGPSNEESHSSSGGDNSFRPRKSIRINFQDIHLRVRKPPSVVQRCRRQRSPWQTILNHVSGSFESGKITAIMGPSGSGKTSLLNSLAGRISSHADRRLAGICSLNGFDLDMTSPKHIDRLRNVAGYVMQDDILLPRIRVEEQLEFIANMVLDEAPAEIKELAVNRVIDELKLERCRHTLIGQPGAIRGVSGGERKRVAIAEEMVRDPQVLYLDEPTSGLDSETALVVCLLLSKLAAAGRTIVLTIHQPSSTIFSIFDSVILLSKGNLVCSGTQQEIAEFFASRGSSIPLNVNPADFILHVLSESEKAPDGEDSIQQIVPLSKLSGSMTPHRIDLAPTTTPPVKILVDEENLDPSKHAKGGDPSVDTVSAVGSPFSPPPLNKRKSTLKQMKNENIGRSLNQRPNFFKRVWLLLKRSWISNSRTPDATIIKSVQYVMISLFASFIFFQLGHGADGIIARSGALFAYSLLFSFTTSAGVVLLFPSERGVFLRESVRRIYDPTEYFIAKSLTEMPFQIIFSIISMAISYFIIGLNPTAEAFFKQTFVLLLVAVIGSGIGLAVGGAIENTGAAMELCPSLIIPQMLIAGVFVSRDQIPVWLDWFQKCSFLTWSYAAQIDTEFGGVNLGVNSSIAPTGQGSEVLHFYGIDTPYGEAIGILIANVFAYRLIGLAIFWYVCKKQQSE